MKRKIKEYKDIIFNLGRDTLIIGLTGFTGAGCSTAKKILTGERKVKFPNYSTVKREKKPFLEKLGYDSDKLIIIEKHLSKVNHAIKKERKLTFKKQGRYCIDI